MFGCCNCNVSVLTYFWKTAKTFACFIAFVTHMTARAFFICFLLPLLQVCSMLSSVSWRDFLRGKSFLPLIRKSPLNKPERHLVFVFPEETAFSLPSRESSFLLSAHLPFFLPVWMFFRDEALQLCDVCISSFSLTTESTVSTTSMFCSLRAVANVVSFAFEFLVIIVHVELGGCLKSYFKFVLIIAHMESWRCVCAREGEKVEGLRVRGKQRWDFVRCAVLACCLFTDFAWLRGADVGMLAKICLNIWTSRNENAKSPTFRTFSLWLYRCE